MQLKLLASPAMQPLLKWTIHGLCGWLCCQGLQDGHWDAAVMHLGWASPNSGCKEDNISAFGMMFSIAFG